MATPSFIYNPFTNEWDRASGVTGSFVPYTGATSDVDLGLNNLTVNTLNYTTLNPPVSGGSGWGSGGWGDSADASEIELLAMMMGT
jgi:hypothetical protein